MTLNLTLIHISHMHANWHSPEALANVPFDAIKNIRHDSSPILHRPPVTKYAGP